MFYMLPCMVSTMTRNEYCRIRADKRGGARLVMRVVNELNMIDENGSVCI